MAAVCWRAAVAGEEWPIEFPLRGCVGDYEAPFVGPFLLRWKYWELRTDCSKPRSTKALT